MREAHDDHIHLRGHTKPPPPHDLASVTAAARAAGVEPGIREHAPLPRRYRLGEFADYEYAMIESEQERFLSLFEGSETALGLEVDFLPGCEEETRAIMDGMLSAATARGIPVSGVLGSVHLLPGDVPDIAGDKGGVREIIWDLDESIFTAHIRQRGPTRVLDDYFNRIEDCIATGMFDALSHLELIRKFDRTGPDGKSVFFGGVEPFYRMRAMRVIERAAAAGMAVELNTSGARNPLGRPYLSAELLRHCADTGARVCLGSDAHCPEQISAHFDLAREMCRAAGISRLVTFRDRKAVSYEF